MLTEVLTLHPQMSVGRGGGYKTQLFGAENRTVSPLSSSRLKVGSAIPAILSRQ